VQKEINNLSQGSLSISDYLTKCKILWDEYATLVNIPTCPNAECPIGDAMVKLLAS